MLTSCSSVFYSQTSRTKNNTVTVRSNASPVTVELANPPQKPKWHGTKISGANTPREITLPKLNSRYTNLKFSSPNYDSKIIKVKKTPRASMVAVNLLFSGIPIVIDIFNSDFYKISKSSRNLNVKLDYSQGYMDQQYERIANSNEPGSVQRFIDQYPNSTKVPYAIDRRDRLELDKAIAAGTEAALTTFINKRPKSTYVSEAVSLRSELAQARAAFDEAKQMNSIQGYNAFLEAYPTSKHRSEVCVRLVTLAESEARQANNLDAAIAFANDYLYKYKKDIGGQFEEKEKDFKSRLSDYIKDRSRESDGGVRSIPLWTNYVQTRQAIPQLGEVEGIESLRPNIYCALFGAIQNLSNIQEQNDRVKWLSDQLPLFFGATTISGTIREIIDNCKEKDGIIAIFGLRYLENATNGNNMAGLNKDIYIYSYKGSRINVEESVFKEELSYTKNTLIGRQKFFDISGNPVVDFYIGSDTGKLEGECNYYQNGSLAKTKLFEMGYEKCEKEFDNGVNITQDRINKLYTRLKGEFKSKDAKMLGTIQNINDILCAADESSKNKIIELYTEIDVWAQAEKRKEEKEKYNRAMDFFKMLMGAGSANGGGVSNEKSVYPQSGRSGDAPCSYCNGTGIKMCHNCGNRRTIVCSSCRGRGSTTILGRTEMCSNCGGRGETICRTCDGRPHHCQKCKGTGRAR
ncbi:MAG TPA: hypothetical protein PKD45_14985 [Flavobacteriales bacterium]|nr:hypothetical protein [Flavobacteriales bacterium]